MSHVGQDAVTGATHQKDCDQGETAKANARWFAARAVPSPGWALTWRLSLKLRRGIGRWRWWWCHLASLPLWIGGLRRGHGCLGQRLLKLRDVIGRDPFDQVIAIWRSNFQRRHDLLRDVGNRYALRRDLPKRLASHAHANQVAIGHHPKAATFAGNIEECLHLNFFHVSFYVQYEIYRILLYRNTASIYF